MVWGQRPAGRRGHHRILCIFFYNYIHKLAAKVSENSAGIDIVLAEWYDLLSEELEAVLRFLKHEYETYTSVVDRRSEIETEQQDIFHTVEHLQAAQRLYEEMSQMGLLLQNISTVKLKRCIKK